MLKNYLKVAWRNLMKNKVFSFINIFGLAVGLTCCMLIALYLKYETSYDSNQKNINNLYQVGTVFIKKGEKDSKTANTPSPLAPAMKEEFPEVQESARLLNLFAEDKTLIQYEQGNEKKSFYETNGYLADPSFFQIFSYNFIEGNSSTSLSSPNTAVINKEIAKKLFGGQSALGKRIHISSNTNGDHDFIVTGVFTPSVTPSHIKARFFLSITGGDMESYMKNHANDFASNNMFYSYLLLKPGSDPKKLEAKFPAFMDKYASVDLKKAGFDKKQFLIPVKDIHLDSEVPKNATPPASKTYLYILASIAVFILLIACINFMNLATARSSKRSAEVGVRKVLGAQRRFLIWQFIGESMLMALIAFILAICLMFVLLPVFNKLAAVSIILSFAGQRWLLAAFFVLALITGLLAGSYPAFYLSSFKPVRVLKGKFTNSFAAIKLRKALVIFQFVISVVLIIASVVIARQMNYMRSADLGFEKDQQIIIPLRSNTARKIYTSFKNEVKANPQVVSVGASLYYPGIFNPSDNGFYKSGQTMTEAKRTRTNWVDYDFLKTLGLKLAAGRLFSPEFPADTSYRVVVNEEAIKEIGFSSPAKAVGDKLYFDWKDKSYGFEIVGVVKDFHFEDLHLPVTPYAFEVVADSSSFNYVMIHARTADISGLIQKIQGDWHKLNGDEPFEYSFLDEEFNKNYKADDRLATIVNYFTIVAILICCLGLFGLATFSAEQRTKEIGVRKVLGASVTGIVALLSKDFIKLVTISIVVASPIAWYVMNKWLQDFAYRTDIGLSVFVLTAVISLLIALATISFQAIRAAIANPVKSLRTE